MNLKYPPLNKCIWVSANNYTWFCIKVTHLGRNCFVCRKAYQRSDYDIVASYDFHTVYKWKYKLDGTEKSVVKPYKG